MSWLEALILGIIQGLTEFLPVSSSGHIELANAFFENKNIEKDNLLFTVVLHAATAISTLVVYWKDIRDLLIGLFKSGFNDEKKFILYIIISMIPAVIVGLVFEDEIESVFTGNILLVGSMLLLTGLLLLLADRAKSTNKSVGPFHSIIVGIAQAIAILPGISRSGATISATVLLGIDREKAARFSFLMVVPLILGKMAKDILSGDISSSSIDSSIIIIGFIAAFITGLAACKIMIAIVRKSKLTLFAVYCFLVGISAIIYQFTQ